MQPKSRGNRRVEKNIDARSDGYSFRVRMKVGEILINETFFTLDEACAYRDLLRAGKATDRDQEKVLRAKAEKKKSTSFTIDSLLLRYSEEVTPAKKSYKEESYTISRLRRMKAFSNLPVYLADGAAVERLKLQLVASGLSNTTVRKYLMLISHAFRIAITRRWCPDLQNPIKTVELPKPARMRNRRFEQDEFEYLRAELAKARNPQMLPFFEFLIETACRRGEALRLRFRDVDLTAQTARLNDTKNGEDRIVGLSSRACSILGSLLQGTAQLKSEIEKVVPLRRANGEQKIFSLSINAIRYAFQEALGRAQKKYKANCVADDCQPRLDFLVNIRLHDCRREATSRMFEKGLDIMEVSSMTGHKTLSMLRGYTNLRAMDIARKLG